MRFFIALEIPEYNKKQIQLVQKKLQKLIPSARITQTQKLHLTLAFIGEQPEDLKDNLIKVIGHSAREISAFEITPAYIDGFPNIHKPNILWVGVKGDVDKLLLIRERVKDLLTNLGLIVDERRFTPHITIAKIVDLSINQTLETKLQEIMVLDFNPIKITSIKLFESIPEGNFHKHNTLAEVKLESSI